MKVEIVGFNGGFWVRNALRALLAWLWFDHGRWLTYYGGGTRPTVGIEIIILVSLAIAFALEAFYRDKPEKSGKKADSL